MLKLLYLVIKALDRDSRKMLDSISDPVTTLVAALIVSGKRLQSVSWELFWHIPELNCESVKGFCLPCPRFYHYELHSSLVLENFCFEQPR